MQLIERDEMTSKERRKDTMKKLEGLGVKVNLVQGNKHEIDLTHFD